MANRTRGKLYVGVTTDLAERVNEHRLGISNEYTIKHHTDCLVHFEQCDSIKQAEKRRARIRKWNRDFRIGLVERFNPKWKDLYDLVKSGGTLPPARE
jgi:putative endonuclease